MVETFGYLGLLVDGEARDDRGIWAAAIDAALAEIARHPRTAAVEATIVDLEASVTCARDARRRRRAATGPAPRGARDAPSSVPPGSRLVRRATRALNMDRAQELIDRLGLIPHPERGYYVETYRAPLTVGGLPHGGPRVASTAIYFLVTRAQPTTYLHRLKSDELFHLYEGGPLDVLLLGATGGGDVRRLGLDVAAGSAPSS